MSEPAEPTRFLKHRLVGNIASVYGAQLATGLLGVLLVPIATRLLGFDGYALWSIYGAMQGFVVLVEFGLGKNLVRLLAAAESEDQRELVTRNAVASYLLVAIVLCLLALPLAWFATLVLYPVPKGLEAVALTIALLAVADYLAGIPAALRVALTMGSQEFSRLARYNAASGVLRFGFPILALLVGASPVWVVVATLARRLPEWWLATRLLTFAAPGSLRPSFERERIGMFFRQTSSLAYAQVLQLAIMSLGTYLIGRRGDMASVGEFRGLFDIASKVWFLSSGLGLVVFPAFASMLAQPERRGRLAAAFPLAARTSLQAYALVLGIGTVLALPFLPLLGFPDARAQLPFALLLFGSVALAHGNTSYELLQAEGRFARVAMINAAVLLAYAAVAAVVGASTPLTSVAMGWAFAQACGVILLDVQARSLLGARAALGQRAIAALALSIAAVIAAAPDRGLLRLGLVPLGLWVLWGAYRDGLAAIALVRAPLVATAPTVVGTP